MWFRVFGKLDVEPSPVSLADSLHAAGLVAEPHFKGDDLGWTSGELRLSGGTPILLERFLASNSRRKPNAAYKFLEVGVGA